MNELKVGDCVWRINYWRGSFNRLAKREIEKRKIMKVTPKKIKLSFYDSLWVFKERVNKDEWFTSRLKALENKKDLHDNYYLETKDKDTLREIKKLDKMIYNEELKEAQEITPLGLNYLLTVNLFILNLDLVHLFALIKAPRLELAKTPNLLPSESPTE